MPEEAVRVPSKKRILVVDDDPQTLHIAQAALEKADFEVLTADAAETALEIINKHGLPHLTVIDIVLPGMDGLALCRKLAEFSDLPIVLLSSVDEEKTVVSAIEDYAEDYIVKPFNPSELVARVRRVLRRIGDFSYTLEPLIQVDEHLAIDFARQRAEIEGRPVALTPTESKLLYILMGQAGQTVPTDYLLGRLWPGEDVFESTLRVHIHRLRQKIEVSPGRPRYIVTERGAGYSFQAPWS